MKPGIYVFAALWTIAVLAGSLLVATGAVSMGVSVWLGCGEIAVGGFLLVVASQLFGRYP